jgi:hypothetical protein
MDNALVREFSGAKNSSFRNLAGDLINESAVHNELSQSECVFGRVKCEVSP